MMQPAAQGIRQPHSSHGRYAWVLLGPALLLAVLFFIVPISAIVASSFSQSPASHSFTFANYLAVITDGFYWQILLRTIRISVVATIVGLIVCYPAALHIYFSSGKWRQIFLLVVISPLLVSSVVRTFGWIVVMSPNGALNSVIPGGLPFQLLYSETGVMIGLIHIQLPIVVLSLNASLSKLDKRLLSAASSLGASNYQILRDVIIPLSFPGLIAASTIMFVTSMTAFAIPILLGGSQTKTAAFLIYQLILLVSDWHVGSAFALFLVFMTMTLVFIFTRMARALLPQAVQ